MNEPALAFLKDHFQRAFAAAGQAAPGGVFEALVERYREPSRAYHTLQHIGEGITHLATIRNAPAAVGIAWWFHDAIYDPKRHDNEERSAAWAAAVLGQSPLSESVQKLVLATKHAAVPEDSAGRLIVDVDLAIFAVPEPRYSEYEAQVRREYAFIEESAYRLQRLKVLRSFYDRAYIYQSPEFRVFETRARKNLERATKALILGK